MNHGLLKNPTTASVRPGINSPDAKGGFKKWVAGHGEVKRDGKK